MAKDVWSCLGQEGITEGLGKHGHSHTVLDSSNAIDRPLDTRVLGALKIAPHLWRVLLPKAGISAKGLSERLGNTLIGVVRHLVACKFAKRQTIQQEGAGGACKLENA